MSKDKVKEAFQRIINDDYEETAVDLHLANCDISMIYRLINEHFDNPPLKFEDLTHYMWVWDNRIARYYHAVCYTDDFGIKKICLDGERLTSETEREFEDGRYYAREVTE